VEPSVAFVIDDEEGICRYMALALTALGLKAHTFSSAEPAFAALQTGHPHIVFLDIALKGSDAVDVIRRLGEVNFAGTVQLMSGSDVILLDDVRRIGDRHGLKMRPPLQKPVRPDAIREAVAGARTSAQHAVARKAAPVITVQLEEALANNWLELWYQPKIDLRSRTLGGLEGLIRCRHPQHGVLGPDRFLPNATQESLAALTEYVVIAALRDSGQLAEAGTPLRIAVNSSVGALTDLHLPKLIRDNRPRGEKWPGLILEVTESVVVNLLHEIATQLRIYGVTLAIDDFGEGYSSFARLRELPFGELKLDGSFVDGCSEDAKNAGICRAVIELAHHFGVVAVAERLERPADLEAIEAMGCDIGQGYYFSRPMPKPELLPLVSANWRKAWAQQRSAA
jgi:EAL domain-containing protein (putative c-di-GMP-specific phosphodiesterase class I)/CheY-like chemotaxis protein